MGQGCGQEESKSGCFKSAKLIKVTVWLIVPQRKYIVRRFLEARDETFVAAWDFVLRFTQAASCSTHATQNQDRLFVLQKIEDQRLSSD